MNYVKPKLYKGGDLDGTWAVTIKLDGVRMLRNDDGVPTSRDGNPLNGLDGVPAHIVDAEIFCGSWEASITAVKTIGAPDVIPAHVFSLFPALDARLFICQIDNPKAEEIDKLMNQVVADGHEGLVLRELGGKMRTLKVKPFETYDVVVEAIEEGKGKFAGAMGKLTTPMGKVGTGFSEETRKLMWHHPESIVGKTIEVKCMSLTKNNKFRHARFVRIREDK